MPPRYAYWTILIDGKATAFRAREREELLPTFNQLARKNADIVMKYFARGRLWDTPEQAEWASRNMPRAVPGEKRGRDWRPGGLHKDPRARFARKKDGDARPDARKTTGRSYQDRFVQPRDPSAKPDRAKPQAPYVQPKDRGKPEAPYVQPKDRRALKPETRDAKPRGRWTPPPRRKPR